MLKFAWVRIRKVGSLGHLFCLALFGAAVSAQAVSLPPENLQLLLFKETSAGRKLSQYLIGRAANTHSDLEQIIQRLSQQDIATRSLRDELELRIAQLSRELGRLPKNEHNILPTLESLSARLVQFEMTAGEVHFKPFLSEAPSSSFARSSQIFIEARAPTRFEEGVPRGRDSIEAELGPKASIYERLLELEGRFVHELGVLDTEALAQRLALRKPDLTVKDVTDEIIRIRVEMSAEFEKLSRIYQQRLPILAQQLQKTAGELRLSPEARGRYQNKAFELQRIPFEPKRYDDVIRGYSGKIQGELGELRVLVRVNGFSARGLLVGELGELFPAGPAGERARAALEATLRGHPNFAGKELDLILDQGRTWAEVKTFRDVFTRSHGQFDHVLEQAEMTRNIRDLIQFNPALREVLPDPIRLQIYFVGGVTESAASALEALGYEVLGARFGSR